MEEALIVVLLVVYAMKLPYLAKMINKVNLLVFSRARSILSIQKIAIQFFKIGFIIVSLSQILGNCRISFLNFLSG